MTNERLTYLQEKYSEKLKPKSLEELSKLSPGPKRGGGHGGGPRGAMASGKPKNAKGTIKRLFSYLSNDKYKIVFVCVCVLLSTFLSLASSYMLRPVINNLTAGAGARAKLIQGCLTMAMIYSMSIITQYTYQRVMVNVSQNAIMRVRNDLFSKVSKLPVSYFDKNSNGDIMSRFTNDVDTMGEVLNSTVIQLVTGVIQMIGTIALMIYTNWVLTLITIVLIPFMMFCVKSITTRSRKYYRNQQTAIGVLNGYIEETINGQKVVKVFNHEEAAKEEFEFLNDDLRNKQIKAMFFGGIMGPIMGNLGQMSYALTACIGGVLCVARGFDVGGLTIFVNYSRQFSWPINQIAMQVNTIFSALAGAERVFAAMDEPAEEADPINCVHIIEENGKYQYVIPKANDRVNIDKVTEVIEKEDADNYYVEVKGGVRIENLVFGYVPEKTVLKDVSLYAKPGQKIAFVGSTGAGKTTITNLINRFYDLNSGTVYIDEIPVNEISRSDLRRSIAMVLQDTHLFTGSIKDNIRYGRMDATDEDVINAAKTASAHSFIMRLENGYDTIIDGDGANLSQGQRQLINIARAAISKAPILILDEATSSVDTRTEKHIEHGMDRLMKSRTTLVIAHRLSTVRNANAIMVLENGQIIERGDHDALLNEKGRYYELYTGKSELS